MIQTNVATKIDQLLARVAGIRRASDLDKPTKFDAEGEAAARRIAARDAAVGDESGMSERQPKSRRMYHN